MATYDELKRIALTRLEEAKILHKNSKYDGAAYLCGYVLEIALKARICRLLHLKEYPDTTGELKKVFAVHNFETLLKLSGLESKLLLTKQKRPELFTNWSMVTGWTPESRYKPIGSHSEKSAREMIEALTDSKYGVFTWLQKRW